MSTPRRKLPFNTVSVSLGCGSCRRPRLLRHIFHPKRRPTYQAHGLHWDDTATSSSATNTSAATFSPCYVEPSQSVRGFARAGSDSVAVEKESHDPYLDFRHSMLQMILENEIYSKDDLRELLNCFLQLNSPDHHGVIVRAFTEIWNGVFSVKSGSNGFHLNRKSPSLALQVLSGKATTVGKHRHWDLNNNNMNGPTSERHKIDKLKGDSGRFSAADFCEFNLQKMDLNVAYFEGMVNSSRASSW
ncbi:hypothetical protein VNO78_21101 [Psophocarpus tetragonolobus]|uniref:Transcription repressor n=1 Tax=Psophocarpus tetragonolobus TaxID=3891 RepID=A0AAN9SB05_PSOTE